MVATPTLMAFLRFLKWLLKLFTVGPEEPQSVPPPPVTPSKTKEGLLEAMMVAIKDFEGWYPPSDEYPKGSRSYRNKNPGNLKWVGQENAKSDDKGFAVFPSIEVGFNALRAMIVRAAQGKSKIYKPTHTLDDFFAFYAPSSDNNNPKEYARYVAKRMSVDPRVWQIKNLA